MAKIGDLIVELSADVAKFRTGMDQANSSLKEIEANINAAGEKITGFVESIQGLGAILGIELARRFVEFGERIVENTGSIKEHADAVGLSTKSYQELQFAAQQTGVSSENFDKAIRKLSVSIGQAEEGNKKLIAQFKLAGVSIDDLKTKSPDQIFEKLADGLNRIHDPAIRSAESVALMGRGAAEMANLLAGGSQQVELFRAEAERLGIVIDADTIKKAKQASDELKILGDVLKANETIILSVAIPAIKSLAEWLGKAAEGAKALREGGIAPDVEGLNQAQLQTAIRNTEATIDRLKEKYKDLKPNAFLEMHGFDDPFMEQSKVLEQLTLNLTTYQNKLKELQNPIKLPTDVPQILGGSHIDEELKRFEELKAKLIEETAEERQRTIAISQGKDATDAFNAAVKVQHDVMSLGLKATQAHKDEIEKLSSTYRAYEEQAKKVEEAQKKVNEALKKANPSAEELRKELQKVEDQISTPLEKAQDTYIKQIETLTAAYREGIIPTLEEYTHREAEAQHALEQTTAAFKDSDLKDLGKEAIGAIGKSFEEAVVSGKNLGEVFTSLGQDLEKLILQALIFKPLEQALTNGIGNIQSGGGLAGFLSAFGHASGGYVGRDGAMTTIPRYDNGGSVGPTGSLGGDGARVIVAHDGEFILSRETVRAITGNAAAREPRSHGSSRPIVVNMPVSTTNSDSFQANRHQIAADLYRGLRTAGRFA